MNENPQDSPDNLAELDSEKLNEELKELDPQALAESLSQFTELTQEEPLEAPLEAPASVAPQPNITSEEWQTATVKITELTNQNMSLRQQSDEFREQYIRLRADFDNFRKRVDRDKEELEARLTGKFLDRFLPVLDDFERAQLQIVPKTDGESLIHRSYQSVYKQLQKSIKEAGLIKMETVGQPFDPNYHEAIAQQPSPIYEENIVCEEVRAGYMIGERVLRHALVKVSSEKVASASENLTSEV